MRSQSTLGDSMKYLQNVFFLTCFITICPLAFSATSSKKAAKKIQTYSAIEDENLILLPSNEVETIYFGRPKVSSAELPVNQSPKKPMILASNEPKERNGDLRLKEKKEGVLSYKKVETTLVKTKPMVKLPPKESSLAVSQPISTAVKRNLETIPEKIEPTPEKVEILTQQQVTLTSTTQPKYFQASVSDINSLTYRMRIVQAILEESGKAYDYRSMKTKELVGILNDIRKNPQNEVLNEKPVVQKTIQQREKMRENERIQLKRSEKLQKEPELLTEEEEKRASQPIEVPQSEELPPVPTQTYEEFELAE